jgi:hypothetical protein
MDGKSGSKRVSNHATIVVFAKTSLPFYFLLHLKKKLTILFPHQLLLVLASSLAPTTVPSGEFT